MHYGDRYNTCVSDVPNTHVMTPKAFTATVSAITSAFGDPTRRAIYLHAREHTDGVTATHVAEKFNLHPNVARHHLDKLAAGGYLEVSVEHKRGARAGRPSKHYKVASKEQELELPVHTDDLVLTLLGKALAALPTDQAHNIAEQVGTEYGQAMAASLGGIDTQAGRRSLRSAIQAVADALTAHGFAAHTENKSDRLRIVTSHCPFGDVAMEHPVICAVERGMVKGMLGALYGETEPEVVGTIAGGDTLCVTAV